MSEIFENFRNISECVQYINVPNYSNKFCLIGIGRWNRKSKTRATSLILNLSGFISVTISGLNKKLPITLKKTLHQTQRGRIRRWREGKRRKRRKEWRWRKKEGDLLNPKSASVAVRCCHRCSVSEEQSKIQKKKNKVDLLTYLNTFVHVSDLGYLTEQRVFSDKKNKTSTQQQSHQIQYLFAAIWIV